MGKENQNVNSPPYHILSLSAQMHVVWDDEIVRPVDDLLVRLVRSLRTEGRVPNETLKGNGAQRPPIAFAPVTLLQENLGRDIIRRPDRRISLYKKQNERIPFR